MCLVLLGDGEIPFGPLMASSGMSEKQAHKMEQGIRGEIESQVKFYGYSTFYPVVSCCCASDASLWSVFSFVPSVNFNPSLMLVHCPFWPKIENIVGLVFETVFPKDLAEKRLLVLFYPWH
jgi:hypothetical protein